MTIWQLYNVRFCNHGQYHLWQRYGTSIQEALTSATKALEYEYPEGFRIVSIEKAT